MLNEQQKEVLRNTPRFSDAIWARSVEGLMARHSMTFEQAVDQTIRNYESRKMTWLEKVIDPWARKHGINREQAISVLFFDNTIEGPYLKDCYWNEANDFAMEIMSGMTYEEFSSQAAT